MVIFIIILLLIPLPLQIKIYADTHFFHIKFFNVTILSSKTLSKKNKKASNNFSNRNKQRKFKLTKLINFISNSKYKPIIFINSYSYYALEDAATTAIIYGLLCNIPTILFVLLKKVFSIKKYTFNITPKFTGENSYTFYLSSIICVNIVQIIYILYLSFRSFEYIEEVSPNGEYYGK